MADFQSLAPFSEVILVTPQRHEDARGYFMETYREALYAENGIPGPFVQDNHSRSIKAGTLRGIHFQRPPVAQAKLIRCTAGRIMDYAIDLREGSPSFGQSAAVELSAETGQQLYIPEGFGHAFVTLAPDTEIAYKVSAYFSAAYDSGIHFMDPDLAIEWPFPEADLTLSEKDLSLPTLSETVVPFSLQSMAEGAR